MSISTVSSDIRETTVKLAKYLVILVGMLLVFSLLRQLLVGSKSDGSRSRGDKSIAEQNIEREYKDTKEELDSLRKENEDLAQQLSEAKQMRARLENKLAASLDVPNPDRTVAAIQGPGQQIGTDSSKATANH